MSTTPPAAAFPRVADDLGPLAWVREELRKTLEAATKELRRHLREADAVAQGGSNAPDGGHLAQAGRLLRQCTGALAMIEQPAAAHMLRAMEAATQRLAEQPEACTEEAVTHIERAGFAMNDYLDALLAGKPVSAVSLFPQYRDVQAVAGNDRIHPADLWTHAEPQAAPTVPVAAAALAPEPAVRSRLDQAVLQLVKTGDPAAARALHALGLGLAAGAALPDQASFWNLAAAYFEAVALGLVPSDLYAKRMASRVLTQYAALARGEAAPSARLVQDLLFYCARAVPGADAQAGTLAAVRSAHGLGAALPVDYEDRRFGRFDPAQLAQARKRIAAAAETWSALAGGDTHPFKTALEQFALVGESLTRLHPDSAVLTQALQRTVEAAAHQGTVPAAPLAMEVATAVLYLEAAYADLDEDDAGMRARAALLTERLDQVAAGGAPEPLQPWMEELYHRVSDRQTMGHVVEELRRTLAEIEQTLDQFFRAPREKMVLARVVAQCAQMRGVLSVLGLEQAAHAVQRMRETVEGYMADAPDDAPARAASFDRLGASLGALGLLIDMLGYQRALARELFVYDESQGLLRMALPPQADAQPADPAHDPPQLQPAVADAGEGDSAALQVFADEARQAVHGARLLTAALRATPADADPLPALRRVFHRLKGSARMVDQPAFGDTAWALEDLLTAWLATQQPATPALLDLADDALQALAAWADDIAAGRDGDHHAADLRVRAETLQLEPEASAPAPAVADEDGMRAVGPLRIALPLDNAYLNDADESSRRLLAGLGAWSQEPATPLDEATIALARDLADSAARIGFHALSQLAHRLVAALAHVQAHGLREGQGRVLLDAAEDVRRLLHQFAAGFLKEPNAAVQHALETIVPTSAPAPAATGPAFDDAIDVADAIDPDLFPVFDDEAAELLPRLGAALRQWSAEPADTDARQRAQRALHTLKGSARLAGALRLGESAHRLETAIEPLAGDGVPTAAIAPLLAQADALQTDLDRLRAAHQPAPLGALSAQPDTEAHEVVGPQPIPVPQPLAPRAMSNQSVRVRSQLLDRMINQSGEVLITRARMQSRLDQLRGALGDLGGNLDRLRQQLREVELQADSQMQSRLAQARDTSPAATPFDPLEFDRFTRVQELTRMMAESVNDVATVQRSLQRTIEGTEDDLAAQARQARELQHDLLRMRMVAFDAIAERLHGVVRQAATDLGRHVQLEISGGLIELDRGVLDRLAPTFEHLLRNAIVHGIEDAPQRSAAGKPEAGRIEIALHHEANDIAIRVQDDGRGLDLPRIQARALSLGLLSSGAPLSAGEAADLIFLPGFTTAHQVTGLAGRGIGMDVVRTEVHGLGGRIETRTTAGQGTEFKIVLPLTTAVTQVAMLRAGPHCVGVPTNLVEAVRRVPAAALAQAYASETFAEGGEALPFYWAGALLQSAAASEAPGERHASVLVLRSASQRLALHVDEVLGQQDVVVKNLGPQLSRLPGLAGMSVLASGAVVLIYNPVALAAVHGAQARQAQHDQALRSGDGGLATTQPPVATPLVLVVDDSVTVRRVTQRLLQRAGYRVALAADGVQALEVLQAERPALVLSDIEMPRMDGFDLARTLRADTGWAGLPIVMITSRMAEKHRTHALSIGVDHYLGKPYSEEELLSLVRRYTVAADGAD
ncbi:response regulator [Pseudorhodoferax sp. Leaf267]|uniref:hybrid sensor histidine kinase/response regulator n=1 Tax=Pseudorhodoferax sp. Leaf267 TaxID=1736316 RepID=UPI0007000B53|nr:response regulator [Pseudorhodoferax sp. Leaf267]KQP20582.1 hypothetical protein ASF43_27555 [Pseudorhodoferax sp. Leaf267]